MGSPTAGTAGGRGQRVSPEIAHLLRVVAEHAADVLAYCGPDGVLAWVSPSVTGLLGWDPHEVIGHPVERFRHPEDVLAHLGPAPDEGLRSTTGAGPAPQTAPSRRPLEVRAAHRDGTYRWVEAYARAVLDGDGDLVGRVLSLFDIEAEVDARRSRARSRQRLRLTMESAPLGMCLLSPDGTFLEVNPAFCRMMGRDQEAMLQLSWRDLTHPDEAEPLALRELREGRRDGFRTRKRYVRPDGTVVWGDLSVVAVRDSAGRMLYHLAQVVDVTAEVTAVQELANREARYRLLAENASDIVLETSIEGVVTWISPSVTQLLGLAPPELVGLPLTQLAAPEDGPALLHAQAQLLSGHAQTLEIRMRRRDGGYRWVCGKAHPIFDDDGRVVARVSGWRDIDGEVTAREALAEALEQYRLLAESALEVVLRSRDGTIVWISPSVSGMLGGSPADWVGINLRDVASSEDRSQIDDCLAAIGRGEGVVRRFRTRGGRQPRHWVELHGSPYIDRLGHAVGERCSLHVVDAEVAAQAQLERMARFDGLTGLLTRQEIMTRLREANGRNRRHSTGTALLFCDVDHLKEVNDTFGHATGDDVLRVVAERLLRTIRRDDVAARLGGDELLVLLVGLDTTAQAVAVAEKIREAARGPIPTAHGVVHATLSIGVTLVRGADSAEDAVARADRAMYTAKNTGRDQVVMLDR